MSIPIDPASLHPILSSLPAQRAPVSLPLLDTKNGSLFQDRNSPNHHWYLPDFSLANDIDASFAFAASQTGQQANGQPFNVAEVTLRVCKAMAADAVQFAQKNPGAILQEIPLANMTAFLSSDYTDSAGVEQQRTFNSTGIQDLGDGSFLISFNQAILGNSVIGLYQDLRLYGKAIIQLSASYSGWAKPETSLPLNNMALRRFDGLDQAILLNSSSSPSVNPSPLEQMSNSNLSNLSNIGSFEPARNSALGGNGVQNPPTTPPPPPPPSLIKRQQAWKTSLPLGLKYNSDGYQLKYTLATTGATSHVILNVNDLSDFNQSQSEFAELKALGDLSVKYPTLSRAYFGVLSRSIVLIAHRYSMVRSSTGCAATCLAQVDSSSASGSHCCFEFDFTIAPDISRIEFAKLQQEIATNADFNGYHLTFPSFCAVTPPSTLQTAFTSNVQIAAGIAPYTFAVTVLVQDNGTETPAVADANLFILRLCSQTGTDLIGSLSLKLDDGYPNPILTPIDLNFARTVSTDELVMQIDEAGNAIQLTNQSPLDLQLSNYALIQNATITELSTPIGIAAGATVPVPLPTDHANLQFAADAQLVIPNPMSLAATPKFLNFQTVDVQETQYVVAVDASGVDYSRVASITASITFGALPNLTPSLLSLSQNVRADSVHIVIPLENAVFSLPGTVNFTIHFVNPTANPVSFTIENEFTSQPVFFLLQNAIDQASQSL